MKSTHLLVMLACCLAPLAVLAAIYIIGIPATNVLLFGLVLLCPLSHLLLMKFMAHDEHTMEQVTHRHIENK